MKDIKPKGLERAKLDWKIEKVKTRGHVCENGRTSATHATYLEYYCELPFVTVRLQEVSKMNRTLLRFNSASSKHKWPSRWGCPGTNLPMFKTPEEGKKAIEKIVATFVREQVHGFLTYPKEGGASADA